MKVAAMATLSVLLLAGCGYDPAAFSAQSARVEAEATNLFADLKDVRVVQGAPSDGYLRTRRHVDAKTSKNGRVWILDQPDGVRVLHNTQDVTNARKLSQLVVELEKQALALQVKNPGQSKELLEFVALLRK